MKRILPVLLFALLLAVSCTSVPKRTIDTSAEYDFKPAKFELNPQNTVFSAEGSVTMWLNVPQYKGRFNGDYEILSASPETWRMMITGPFNMAVATVIIKGETADIFHEGKWDKGPWSAISKELFNAEIDGNLLSLMLGGRFRFDGLCADRSDGEQLCKTGQTFYKIKNGEVVEVASGELYIINEKPGWHGIHKSKNAFIFKNKKFTNVENFEDSLFEVPKEDEKDEFDEL